jgi:hypothetical protein
LGWWKKGIMQPFAAIAAAKYVKFQLDKNDFSGQWINYFVLYLFMWIYT